jgi:site-specific DNA-methyltransferase (adenine-specific)
VKITNEDNMDLMSRYKDNYFDLAIVDPPFGIGNFVQTNNRGSEVKWNDNIPSETYFNELKRVSKNRIIFGANYFNCFEEKGGAIVWVKNQPMPNFSKCVVASCSMHKKIEMYNQTWTNINAKDRAGIHPCEMPISLYEWILMNYAKKGDKILDTHLGSGSIAIACHNLKYDLTACELDKEYYNAAMKRIKQHQSQIRLI